MWEALRLPSLGTWACAPSLWADIAGLCILAFGDRSIYEYEVTYTLRAMLPVKVGSFHQYLQGFGTMAFEDIGVELTDVRAQ